MDVDKARQVLRGSLAAYRRLSYDKLLDMMAEPEIHQVQEPGSPSYQIEIQVFYDDPVSGTIRVIGSIDDGGWRAILPVSEDFIMAPDGSFVGE